MLDTPGSSVAIPTHPTMVKKAREILQVQKLKRILEKDHTTNKGKGKGMAIAR